MAGNLKGEPRQKRSRRPKTRDPATEAVGYHSLQWPAAVLGNLMAAGKTKEEETKTPRGPATEAVGYHSLQWPATILGNLKGEPRRERSKRPDQPQGRVAKQRKAGRGLEA